MPPIDRKTLRQRRRALTPTQQKIAATALSQQLSQTNEFQRAQRIAYYLANDGEISPQALINQAQRRGKSTYLPVLHPLKYNRLYFAQHHPRQALRKNRFGIAEPSLAKAERAAPWTLDIILLPLVGFDRSGNRLGMGAGFYDRTLARLHNSGLKRPLLIGLAHHCQEVAGIDAQSWDIPLDIITTDQELIRVSPILAPPKDKP